MLLASAILILLAFSLPWLVKIDGGFRRSPYRIFSLVSFLQIFPAFIVVALDSSRSSLFSMLGDSISDLMIEFSCVYTVALIFAYIGIYCGMKFSGVSKVALVGKDWLGAKASIFNYWILISVYFIGLLLVTESAGGIVSFASNFSGRAQMLAGKSAYFIFMTPALFLAVFVIVNSYSLIQKPKLPALLIMLLIAVLLSSLLGGRRAPVSLLIFAVISMLILKRNSKVFSKVNISLIGVAVAVFAGLLFIRLNSNDSASVSIDIISVMLNASFNDIYFFILHAFASIDHWHGEAFIDLIRMAFGAYNSDSAPPIDDGVYIFNLFYGNSFSPPTAMSDMYWNSWPGGSFGMGIANFGYFGAWLFLFINGLVVGIAYSLAVKSNLSPLYLFLYLWIVFVFQVSSLGLVQFFMLILGAMLIVASVQLINKIKIIFLR